MGWTNVVVFVGKVASPVVSFENGYGKSGYIITVYNPKYLPKLKVGEVAPVPKPVKIECVFYEGSAEALKKIKINKGDVISVEGQIENIKKLDKPTMKTFETIAIKVKGFTLLKRAAESEE